MDYYGLLFLYYLKGLSGKSILRLFLNIEAGGTEQLLPENTSTPTTTPILADIQYPDGLRTDQYFTYRETPTTVSNKARIKTIKGNTLVWNQLIQNGNFADDSVWSQIRGTLTVQNNVGTYEVTEVGTSNSSNRIAQSVPIKANHKYAFIGSIMGSKDDMRIIVSKETTSQYFVPSTNLPSANTWYKIFGVGTPATDGNVLAIRYTNVYQIGEIGDKLYFKNLMFFDLTQLGIDSLTDTEVEQWFASLFPLSYYAYNQGSLLSFMGNGIKTVGKNLFSTEGNTWYKNNVSEWNSTYDTSSTRIRSMGFPCKKGTYTISGFPTSNNISLLSVICYDINHNYLGNATRNGNTFVISFDECEYIALLFSGINFDSSTNVLFKNADIQVEFGSSASSYEPYTSSTLSLPISTYFPTGMKSAGDVYDELTPSKAITRIGAVDLGSLTWTKVSGYNEFRANYSSNNIPLGRNHGDNIVSNVICTAYPANAPVKTYRGTETGISLSTNYISVGDTQTTYADATAFKTAMNGVYLYYELATPTETPITTEDANEALSLLMGKSVSSSNAKQMIDIITKGE